MAELISIFIAEWIGNSTSTSTIPKYHDILRWREDSPSNIPIVEIITGERYREHKDANLAKDERRFDTPADPNVKLHKDKDGQARRDTFHYRSLIGQLNYLTQ